ncbi:MAG: peptidoglycan editing factor PgeF [bacterium]|nr:peptidoglycan editing factor PgeF [bacterium]
MLENISEHNGAGVFITKVGDGSFSIKDEQGILVGLKNRQQIFAEKKLALEKAVFCQQTHSDHIFIVRESDAGRGSVDFNTGIPDTDALLTNLPEITLMILVADCVPILLYDPVKKVIGAVHAGWKGTMKHILEKTIQKMIVKYDCDPKDIIAEIGPSIGPDCFEVGEEVVLAAEVAKLTQFVIHRNDRIYFDLWASNKEQLTSTGVNEDNIQIEGICNHCSSDYYSFRRDKNANRFAAVIALKN